MKKVELRLKLRKWKGWNGSAAVRAGIGSPDRFYLLSDYEIGSYVPTDDAVEHRGGAMMDTYLVAWPIGLA